MRYSEEASSEVEQTIVITIFDLGVWMKAYPLVWSSEEKYKSHIIIIVTFIPSSNNWKEMTGSGFSDVLLEAGMITTGSLTGLMMELWWNFKLSQNLDRGNLSITVLQIY